MFVWISHIEKNCLQIVQGRKYHQDRKRCQIGYCNTNEKLLRDFSTDILEIYHIKVRKNHSYGVQIKKSLFKNHRIRRKEYTSWCIKKIIKSTKKS